MVGAGGVEGEGAEDFAGGCVDDADVEVFDEADNAGPGVGSADSDLEHVAVVPQCDFAAGVDAVVADTPVRIVATDRAGFGSRVVGRCWCPVAERSVWAPLVVFVSELFEQLVELGEVGGLVGLRSEPVGIVRLCRTWLGGWGGCSFG